MDINFDIDFGIIYKVAEGEKYTGSYTVEPKFEAQTLATKNKLMSNDVTVSKIKISRVSNDAGGTTVYIGE